jgi:hypothetical protein
MPFTPFEVRNIINSYDRVSCPHPSLSGCAGKGGVGVAMTELERETPNGTKEF